MSDELTVLVASPLEQTQAERIERADPRVRLLYDPDLLPVPRYEGDHHGVPRQLTAEQQQRWDELVSSAEVLFDFDFLDPETLPQRAPRLRWLQGTSAGIGELLRRSGLANTDIIFTTAAGVHTTALAEFVVLGLLYLVKDVPLLQQRQSRRHWERYTGGSLAGSRALVIGLGAVGSEVARSLAALKVEVWGMRRSDAPAPAGITRLVRPDGLHDALAQVDSLVLALPRTDESERLIGQTELDLLKPSAMLVNIARGAVVDETAMVEALRRGRIRGAVLDVFEQEPLPAESPLWQLPNVLISPHSASTVPGENARIVDLFLDNLHRYLEGRPLRNLYDRERGY